MKARNGMRPLDHGAMKGAGRGRCRGESEPGEFQGRGQGGRGRGQHRHGYQVPGLRGWQRTEFGWPEPGGGGHAVRDRELAVLKWQAAQLEQGLGKLNSMIHEFEQTEPGPSEKDCE